MLQTTKLLSGIPRIQTRKGHSLLYFSFLGFHCVTAAFNCAFSFNQHSALKGRFYYPYFTEEESEAEGLGFLPGF